MTTDDNAKMSSAPGGTGVSGEGVSRWQQRKAMKVMMYAMSDEQRGDVASRRMQAQSAKYVPQVQNSQRCLPSLETLKTPRK